jgi:hypothetical protein
MDPLDPLRAVGKRRLADPLESVAQHITERVIDLVVQALDVNALVQQVDVNALLAQVDVNSLVRAMDVNSVLKQVDLDALLSRIDINQLVSRIDIDAIASQTDVGAVIATSSGGMAAEAIDGIRSQGVALDQWINGWVRRLLRRKGAALAAPSARVAT